MRKDFHIEYKDNLEDRSFECIASDGTKLFIPPAFIDDLNDLNMLIAMLTVIRDRVIIERIQNAECAEDNNNEV